MTLEVGPGDVLAVLGSNDVFSRLIRFAARLQGKPDAVDHCVVVTHQDPDGRWMGIEADGHGVHACDATRHLNDPRTRVNHLQPRPNDKGQLQAFLDLCQRAVGTPYDWAAVVCDAADAFGLHGLSDTVDHIWDWPQSDNQWPGHVVCSSLAAALYRAVGWAHPADDEERICAPSDWWRWSDSQAWNEIHS